MRDRRIWNFETNEVVSVTIRQMGSTVKMVRDPDQNWTLAPGSHGRLNPASLDETLYRLGKLKAHWWISQGEAGLERFGFKETAHQVSFEIKKGGHSEVLTIEFGSKSPYENPYASVVLNGERAVFEFPINLYADQVKADLTIPPALRSLNAPGDAR